MKRFLLVLIALLLASPALAWDGPWQGVPTATEDRAGKVKLTTDAEAGDATVTDKALDPESAYDSPLGTKWIILNAVDPETTNSLGEKDEACIVWPETGTWNLVAAEAHSLTASTSGVLTVNLHRVQLDADEADMLSTAITIDVNETDSSTAATAPAIGTSYTVTEGDVVFPEITVAGNGKGCQVRATFRKQ